MADSADERKEKPKSRAVVMGPPVDEEFKIQKAEQTIGDMMDLLTTEEGKALLAKAKKRARDKVDMLGKINSISDIEQARDTAFARPEKNPDKDGDFENEMEYVETEAKKVKEKRKKEEYD